MSTVADRASRIGRWDRTQGRERYLAAYRRAFEDLPDPVDVFDIGTDFGTVRGYRFRGARGSTHPLLLLPGKSSGTPMWAGNLPSLLELGDVFAADLLGEPGLSVQEREIASDADQAAWLGQVLRELPAEAFHLAGVSFGGWSAVNLALHDDSRIATLTLIDPVLTLGSIPLRTIMHTLPATIRWFPKSWRDRFNSYIAGGAPVEDVPAADMIEAGLKHYVFRMPQLKLIPPERLADITVPTLVIIGGRSVIHDADKAAEIAERHIPNATVRVYEGASHAVSGEQPERIARDVATLIAKNP